MCIYVNIVISFVEVLDLIRDLWLRILYFLYCCYFFHHFLWFEFRPNLDYVYVRLAIHDQVQLGVSNVFSPFPVMHVCTFFKICIGPILDLPRIVELWLTSPQIAGMAILSLSSSVHIPLSKTLKL